MAGGGYIEKVISKILNQGNVGVDIFLFFSAIGLCASIQRNNVKTFYENRMKRCMVPFLICAVPYFLWFDFVIHKDGIGQFILNVTTLNFWLKGRAVYSFWYVAAIVLLYLLFPIFYHIQNTKPNSMLLAAVVIDVIAECVLYMYFRSIYDMYEIFLSRIPVFLIGIILSKHILGEAEIDRKRVIILWGALILSFLILVKGSGLPMFMKRYIGSVMGVSSAILYVWVRTLSKEIFKWLGIILAGLGTVSLEIYLVHEALIQVIKSYDLWHYFSPGIWYVIILACTIPVCFFVSALSAKTLRLFSVTNKKQ